VTDGGSEETRPNINIRPTKKNSNTDKRDEPSSNNMNNDKETWIDPYLSFSEDLQETDKQNNSENEEEVFPEEPSFDRIEQAMILMQTT